MNILLPDSWLREHLKTKATPFQIARYLSLGSQSVEKIRETDGDPIYEIEVTTNRADCLSVYGIARELAVLLPRFKIPAKLQPLAIYNFRLPAVKNRLPLEVRISDSSLCPRFTALAFENIKIAPSSGIIRERLEKSGIRSINNIVDLSNYLMLETGQPMHIFDYDKIKKGIMILRKSIEGEKIITLDGETRILPEEAIIIEDGEGRIIDLCGIMGGNNSAVDDNTRKILLFIQTYDPFRIRQTCQVLGLRTEAAGRFEKGINPEGITLALKRAVFMLEKNCRAGIAGDLIDIYPNPPPEKIIKLDLNLVDKIIGIKIPEKEITGIFESLGFSVIHRSSSAISLAVPFWRDNDISIPEDLIEEVARIYGFDRLPSLLPVDSAGEIPPKTKREDFFWEDLVKDILKHWGFTEVYSYSMISREMLEKINFHFQKCLKIANPLTSDLEYMRPSLIPGILQIIAENQSRRNDFKLFELANIYLPRPAGLPDEIPILTMAVTGEKFYELKGVIEGLFREMGIEGYKISEKTNEDCPLVKILHPFRKAGVKDKSGVDLGLLGEVNPSILKRFTVKGRITIADIDFSLLIQKASTLKKYFPPCLYPPLIEDISVFTSGKILTGDLVNLIKTTSPLVAKVEPIDFFRNSRTLRIYYQRQDRSLKDEEIKPVRIKIIKNLEEKLGVKVRKK